MHTEKTVKFSNFEEIPRFALSRKPEKTRLRNSDMKSIDKENAVFETRQSIQSKFGLRGEVLMFARGI